MSVFEIEAKGIARAIDLVEVRRAARLFPDPEHAFVVQSPFGGQRIVAGGDAEAIIAAVTELSSDPCVYWHLHPVGKDATSAKVSDHVRRRWFVVDVDRQKTDDDKELSADDEEKELSRALAAEVLAYLSDRGWPQPVQVDSGNGWHLYYRVDLPNDEPSRVLFKGALAALHGRYLGDAQGEVDPKPYPATAGGKMPGTWAANRKAIAGRPHRQCRFVHVPDSLEMVSAELLQALASEAPRPAVHPLPQERAVVQPAPTSPFEVRAGTVSVSGATPYGKATCERVAGEIAMAPAGTRQQALWNGACRLGELVAARELEEYEAWDKLYVAACRAGLDTDVNCGEKGVRDTIKRGIAKGKENPKPAPGRQEPSAAVATSASSTPTDATPKPIETVSLRELLQDYPKLRDTVIDDLLRLGETANVIASSKFGKSWLVLDLVLCVAAGLRWLGRFQCSAGGVLLIDNELHRETLAYRLRKVAEARGLVLTDTILDRIETVPLRGQLKDIAGFAPLLAQYPAGRFKLIVIDALYRAMPRGMDENANADMAGVYNLIDQYADRLQASFVLIHHASKGSQAGKAVTDIGAGAGSQSRATDTHLVLRPHEDEDAVVVDAALRSFPPIAPLCLRWAFPVFNPAPMLDPSAIKDPKKPDAKAEDASLMLKLNQIDPQGNGVTQTDLQKALGWGLPKLKRAIDRLLTYGTIEDAPLVRTIGKGGERETHGIRRARQPPDEAAY